MSSKYIIRISNTITILMTILAAFITFLRIWVFRTWRHLTMEQLVFQLKAPAQGVATSILWSAVLWCVVPVLLVIAGLIIIFRILQGKRRKIALLAIIVIDICAVGVSVESAWKRLNVSGYFASKNSYSSFIEEHYADPAEIEIIFPEKKQNLIYIFLESVETTFSDTEHGGAFPENVIPNLSELALEGEDFSENDKVLNGGYALYGSGWTMGAMFAHSSGLPMIVEIDGNAMDRQEAFYPSIQTLGDILDMGGYHNVLMIGTDATFAGRRLYYTSHGNYEIIDYVYAKDNEMIEEGYFKGDYWGFPDWQLFEFAKTELIKLNAEDKPFNLTLLTADTHFEDGHACELCRNDFEGNRYANCYACSDRVVSEFVRWVQEQDFYEDTTIVLVGDHTTMDSDFCDDVPSEYDRRVYTLFLNSVATVENDVHRVYSTMDFFPTTLAALGVTIPGNRLGLGTNLFSSRPTLTEEVGVEEENRELSMRSEFMSRNTGITTYMITTE